MDDLTNEQKLILDECRVLLKEHRQLCEESERTGINNDNKTDEPYSRYWHLIHDNFDMELLKKTERRAGHGSFMEPEYIDTLIEVIKEQPKKICTYRGYELIRGIDCWGNISYAPYKNGRQYGDVFDGYDDESAVEAFIKAIDDDPGDPDFML